MVQIENEYGAFGLKTGNCDLEYLTHLKEFAESRLGRDVVLFTTDADKVPHVQCGKIPGVYATVDFGTDRDPEESFRVQRLIEPNGPLVNSEFYTGWLDHWGMPHQKVPTSEVIRNLETMLGQMDANVNLYMIHGGTTFGFNSGANMIKPPFLPQTTSYDYDAPISEAGDLTEKYFAIKNLAQTILGGGGGKKAEEAGDFKSLSVTSFDATSSSFFFSSSPKGNYGRVEMKFLGTIFDWDRFKLFENIVENVTIPLTFEQLGQDSGFVLYEKQIQVGVPDPAELSMGEVRDRAYVFVNRHLAGILGRQEQVQSLPVQLMPGDWLQILVESQARINHGPAMVGDFKGIISPVLLGRHTLTGGWNIYGMPLSDISDIVAASPSYEIDRGNMGISHAKTRGGVSFWRGILKTPCQDALGKDTFLSLPGWWKGFAFINGFNLGRYWPGFGPQQTLYVPSSLVKGDCMVNEIILFELERPGCHGLESNGGVRTNCFVRFVDEPQIDGPTPNI